MKWYQDALWEEGKPAEIARFWAMFCWESHVRPIHPFTKKQDIVCVCMHVYVGV